MKSTKGFSIIFSGKDVGDFLDRLSSNTVKELETGKVQKGAFLDGKASIIALFEMIKRDESNFELRTSEFFKESILGHVDKMLFGEDVKLSVSESHFLDSAPSPFERLPGDVPVESDFLAGTMVLDAALDETIDRNKGCYPGQEVVEKIYSYGRRPKALVRLEPVGMAPAEGEEVFEGEAKIGRVVKTYALDDGNYGIIAIVRRAKARAGLVVEVKPSNIQTKVRDSVE